MNKTNTRISNAKISRNKFLHDVANMTSFAAYLVNQEDSHFDFVSSDFRTALQVGISNVRNVVMS